MHLKDHSKFRNALERAEGAARALAAAGDPASAASIGELLERARSERIVIGVAGCAKRGKSTLVNALLGRSDDTYAPVGRFPATNVVSIFARADRPAVRVRFESGDVRPISDVEIREFVCEERNPGNSKGVRCVEVEGPFVGLEQGVHLVDLPGADNALAEQHAEILLRFLPNLDAIVFLATADEPVNAEEQGMLRRIAGADVRKVFFAVNKKDLVRSGDLDEREFLDGVAHNRTIIAAAGLAAAPVFAISAKDCLEGRQGHGVDALAAGIAAMVGQERLDILADRLTDAVSRIAAASAEAASTALAEASATEQELRTEASELTALRRSLQSGRRSREQAFVAEWEGALDELERNMAKARSELVEQFGRDIDGRAGAELAPMAERLHLEMHQAFRGKVDPMIQSCNERLAAAERRLAGEIRTDCLGTAGVPSATAKSVGGLVRSTAVLRSVAIPGGSAVALMAAPGIVGSVLAAVAPAVPAIGLNPGTWLPWLAGSAVTGTVSAGGAAAVGALTAIALPISAGLVGLVIYKGFRTMHANRAQDRASLKSAVQTGLDEMQEVIRSEVRARRTAAARIVATYYERLDRELHDAEDRMSELASRRPSPTAVVALRDQSDRRTELVRKLADPLVADIAQSQRPLLA